MKKLLIATALLSSVSAQAYNPNQATTKWQMNDLAVGVAMSTDYQLTAVVNTSGISFSEAGNVCSHSDEGKMYGNVPYVFNGQRVKMVTGCYGGLVWAMPMSEAGTDFVLKQFITKNQVTVNGYTVTANGFTATVQNILTQGAAL